jgi:uncharacterized protein YbcI
MGLNVSEIRLTVTDKLLVATVRGFLTPAERELLKQETAVEPLHQLHDQLFHKTEPQLRERVEAFLGKPVRKIHKVYGVHADEMDIIILLE